MSSDDDKELELLSAAVGRAFIEWARIEMTMGDLARHLAECAFPLLLQNNQILMVAIYHMDIKQRISLAECYGAMFKPPRGFHHRLERLLGRIGELKIERNRFAHDTWHLQGGGAVVRVNVDPVVIKPQSFQREIQISKDRVYTKIEQVAEFGKELATVWQELCDLSEEVRTFPEWQKALEMKKAAEAARKAKT